MKDEIIRKNALITGITLFIFCIFSFIVTSYYNYKSLESQLISVSDMVSYQVKESTTDEELNAIVDNFTKNQDWLQIVICNSLGNIVKDSDNENVGIRQASIDEDEIKKANESIDGNYTIYRKEGQILYITTISNDIILRTSLRYEFNTSFLLMNLFIMILLLLGGLFLSIISSRRISNNMLEIIEKIDSHLKTINEGEYQEIEDVHKYVEVEKVLREINEVNRNIMNSMHSIRHEHSKLNFVINNMEQGLIIISGHEEVLLLNDYAKEVLNIDECEEENINYHRILTDETLLQNIEKAIKRKEDEYCDIIDRDKEKIYGTSINYLKNKSFYNTKLYEDIKKSLACLDEQQKKNIK